MTSVKLDSRYTTIFPLVSDLIATESDNSRFSTLNALADQIFSKEEHTQPSFHYTVTQSTYAEIKKQSFSDLAKEIDRYTKNSHLKRNLIGCIAVACLVGAVAGPILGFAALGAALTAAFHYYPYDQPMNALRISATLNVCESHAKIDKSLNELKKWFTERNRAFANIQEPFYLSIYKATIDHKTPDPEVISQRYKFLEAVTQELNNQKKFINSSTNCIYNISLNIIVDMFNNFLDTGDYEFNLRKAKNYIQNVTQKNLDENKLPLMWRSTGIGPLDRDLEPEPKTKRDGYVPQPDDSDSDGDTYD